MKHILRFFLFFSVLATRVFSQQPAATLESLRWLSGCWEGNYGRKVVSEQWMKPDGKMMMGMSRTVKNEKTVEFEFVRLVQEEDGSISYVAKPSGQPETSFKLLHSEKSKIVFENLEHDFPQRIIYQLCSPDSLVARIEGKMNGIERSVDFPYRKVNCN